MKPLALLTFSLGVLQPGKVIHTTHFGHRDLNKCHAPDDNNNIYHVAYLTKLVTAGAVAILVNEGVLDWNLPVWHCLPDFAQREDDLGQKCTLTDLFLNRSGIAMVKHIVEVEVWRVPSPIERDCAYCLLPRSNQAQFEVHFSIHSGTVSW